LPGVFLAIALGRRR